MSAGFHIRISIFKGNISFICMPLLSAWPLSPCSLRPVADKGRCQRIRPPSQAGFCIFAKTLPHPEETPYKGARRYQGCVVAHMNTNPEGVVQFGLIWRTIVSSPTKTSLTPPD